VFIQLLLLRFARGFALVMRLKRLCELRHARDAGTARPQRRRAAAVDTLH
jgi:hypothetical protein